MSIEQNVANVMARIAAAARRSGRNPDEVTVVAVAKTFPPEAVTEAHTAGISVFAENRVQEARHKIPAVTRTLGEGAVSWHMVGHLQRNKAKRAVKLFDLIHSVDSVRLANELEKRCARQDKQMPVLLDINISGEESKYGLPPEDAAKLDAIIEVVQTAPHLILRGLMGMAPFADDPEEARPYFKRLRLLRDDMAARHSSVNWQHLSMGMTDDFEVAVEEGATLVRIGRAIFGERS